MASIEGGMKRCQRCEALVPRLAPCGVCFDCATPAVDWERLRSAYLAQLEGLGEVAIEGLATEPTLTNERGERHEWTLDEIMRNEG